MKQKKSDPLKELLFVLEFCKGRKDLQAYFLQTYIAGNGPVPDEYAEKVRKLMS